MKYEIHGGNRLKGELEIDSAKNSILPIIAGSILCKGKIKIKRCTRYSDVFRMCDILKALGSKISFEKDVLILDNTNLKYRYISSDLTRDIRSSFFTLGPMLARFGKAKISMPGGCAIGERKVNLHRKILEDLGVKFSEQHGYMYCKFEKVSSRELYLDFPSVGATENVMMFASTVEGKVKIHNVAREPEIVDLANFLNNMGAKISGAGTCCLEIEGVKQFSEIEYTPLSDRIITGTMMIAGAITKGNILLKNCNPEYVYPLIKILRKAGCKIQTTENTIKLSCDKKLKSLGRVDTAPYPGFPTDLQSQLTTLACVCDGTSLIKENIFETRFKYVPELIRMGANIKIENNLAIVDGINELYGADVDATDLRGGVSMVLAGLVAKGYTTVHDSELIGRGYYELDLQLRKLGAEIIKKL